MEALRNQPRCEACGRAIDHQGTGRRRVYCSSRCRQQAYRDRRASTPPQLTPYRSGLGWNLYDGDALAMLERITPRSVQTIVTSPPYFGLRDYQGNPRQIGNEPSVDAYVAHLVAVFRAAARALDPSGCLWLNLGDTYSSRTDRRGSAITHGGRGHRQGIMAARANTTSTAPLKNMLMMPARVALALQADGWIVRNDVVWHKPNAKPESVRDRLSTRYEHVYLLTRSQHYRFDLDAIATPGNPGDVWTINTRPNRSEHFAAYPIDLPLRCIAATTRPGDLVLDPFAGLSTTGRAALTLGRRYAGIDVNPSYHDLAAQALDGAAGLPLVET